MDALLSIQLLSEEELSTECWRTQCDSLLSMLNALSEALCNKKGITVCYHPGEVIESKDGCPAIRWNVVVSLGKKRIESLHEFLYGALPLLAIGLPCKIQWKLVPFKFSP